MKKLLLVLIFMNIFGCEKPKSTDPALGNVRTYLDYKLFLPDTNIVCPEFEAPNNHYIRCAVVDRKSHNVFNVFCPNEYNSETECFVGKD